MDFNECKVTLSYCGSDTFDRHETEIVTVRGPVSVRDSQNFQVKEMMIDVFAYPYVDFEYDPCRLARFHLQLPELNLTWFPERITIFGFMSELTANPKLTRNPNEGGWAYLPQPDPTFRPGIVKVNIDRG